jgi:K+-transporting ATPase ATPase C chain
MNALRGIPKSLRFLFFMTILVGVLYPAFVTLVAQVVFPRRANGSLLAIGGEVRGSTLLAQKFESPGYFHPRPSASDYAYVGAGASNLGPISGDLAKAVAGRRAAWAGDQGGPPPEDMLYASASGLDPDISLEAALGQAHRVALARSGAGAAAAGAALEAALRLEIKRRAEKATSLIGPPRVNVVSLNAWLEGAAPTPGAGPGASPKAAGEGK